MNRKVIFLGEMGELFGREHNINCKTVQEAVHAVDCMRGGLRAFIIDCYDKGIEFTVQRGGKVHETLEDILENQEDFVNMQEIDLELGNDDIVIGLAPAGSGKLGEILTTIIGIVLIVVGIMTENPWLVQIGINLVMGGIIMLLAPEFGDDEKEETSIFNGPINNTKVGIPVPLAYGQVEVGGSPINFGFTDYRITSAPGYDWKSSGSTNSNLTHSGSTGAGGAIGEQETFDIDWVLDQPGKMGAHE